VPYAAGGGGDIMSRGIAPGLEKVLGRSVVVENVTGATGSIGLMRAIQSPPDGSTIVYVTAVNTANAAARPQSNVNLNRDLTAIGMIAQSAFVLAVSPALGVNTVQELIALGKSRPGGLRFGSVGPGSNHHFLAEMFKSATSLEMTHIPYRGEAGAIPDLLAGRVDMMFLTASVAPYLEDKRLIGLGISSSETWPSLPNLKPLSEQGLPTMAYTGWNGLMAPKGTPPEVIDKLNKALAVALKSEVALRTFSVSGFKPVGGSPEALTQQINADMKLFERIIREQHLTFDR
jgi:tripartite-type tricarboxylate transporter receptor subunit TctC